MAMKVVLRTIQFKRGPIDKLPKEAKYGEPILVHDEEGKYYLYAGLGEGKPPVLVSGAGGSSDIDLTEVENLINQALENNNSKLKAEFLKSITDLQKQVEEDVDGAIEIYIGENKEEALKRDLWINENGVPDGMIVADSLKENVNELNAVLNELTGLETDLEVDEEEFVFEEDITETEQTIEGIFNSLNLE